eukprot:s11_g40.t1
MYSKQCTRSHELCEATGRSRRLAASQRFVRWHLAMSWTLSIPRRAPLNLKASHLRAFMSEPFQQSCHEAPETPCHFSLALDFIAAVELWLMDSIPHVSCEIFAAMPPIVTLGLGRSGPKISA